ncbi:MAG TPA: LysE family translocator [Spirochaetota bacterium]|nr:LysE family translocator [Spirochaetota bacterium]
MFGIDNYGLFIISGILLNITPGADTVYILSRSVSGGKTDGVLSVAGITSGSLIHTFLAALGLSVILAESAVLFNAVKIAGAAYLILIGIRTIMRAKSSLMSDHDSFNTTGRRQIFFQGFFTSLLNPKTTLFFLSFLPQFVNPRSTGGPVPFLILGLTFATTGTIWCLFLVHAAAGLSGQLRRSNRISLLLQRLTGALFIGLGIRLLLNEK